MEKITAAQYQQRRKALMARLEPQSLVIIPSACAVTRNKDCQYSYRQNSDFWYLTGFNEDQAILVLKPDEQKSILFCKPRNTTTEIWEGYIVGPERAISDYAMEEAQNINQASKLLPEWIGRSESLYYSFNEQPKFDLNLLTWIKQAQQMQRDCCKSPNALKPLAPLLHSMRLYKSQDEVQQIQKACTISAMAHIKAMQACRPGAYEYELEAELIATFTRQGARFPAYNSIVAGGENACTLHYIENNQRIADKDLVLIDAGAEWDNYASDITRTFPANGKFSGERKALYEVVLEANQQAIAAVSPSNDWNKPHEVALYILTQGLVDLGILQGNVDQLIQQKAYQDYYMHRTGHWLGLDVHDVGDYQIDNQWRQFEPGMVTTIEPGLYIGKQANCDPRWQGIGIRIEDDVLVTPQGQQVLTTGVPKEIEAIEAIMA